MKKIMLLLCVSLTCTMLAQNPNFILFDHTNAPFVNDSITWVEVDTNNVKWIGTRNGLYSFNNNSWTVYNTSNSTIPDNRIDKFKIAYDNTIWFVNHNKGFIKFKNNVFTLFNKNNLPGLPTDSLAGLTIDSNDVFLWSDNHGIVKFNSLNNATHTIDSSNSYLQKIDHLVAHGNHRIYGVAKDAMGAAMPPQTFSDSVQAVNDFAISNTVGMPISYCFMNWFNYCSYFQVIADRFGNRYEMIQVYTGSQGSDQRIKHYDKNNSLIAQGSYNQYPSPQIAQSKYGVYSLERNSYINALNIRIFSPPSSNVYDSWNSIIPPANAINFDIDTLNNVWLATPKGLVVYNDIGVITNLKLQESLTTVSVFPNPAQHQVTIRFKNSTEENAIIELTDVLGRSVVQYQLKATNNNEAKIDVSMLPNGIYYYTIQQDSKQVQKGKICILN